MTRRASALIAVALGLLFASLHSAAHAAQPSLDSWQMKCLFQPAQAQLDSETKGRVMIYDGLPDKAVEKALHEHCERSDIEIGVREQISLRNL